MQISEIIQGKSANVVLQQNDAIISYQTQVEPTIKQILQLQYQNQLNKIIKIKNIFAQAVIQERADENLKQFCMKNLLQMEKIDIMYQITQAIGQLHKNQIIHNNILQENFLMIENDLKVGGLSKAYQIKHQVEQRNLKGLFDSLIAQEVLQLGHLFYLIQTKQNLVNDCDKYNKFELEKIQITQIQQEKKLQIYQLGIEILDLIIKMIQCEEQRRITLPEILKWFHRQNDLEITQKAQQEVYQKNNSNYEFYSYDNQIKRVKK